MNISWKNGHRFAFTIFDDADWATIDNVKPVYDLLADLGMRTTKSVWVFNGDNASVNAGKTCEDKEYLEWVLSLKKQGFEIGLHNAAPSTTQRKIKQKALDRFVDLFGGQEIVYSNHVGCLDNIYWGKARVSGWRRKMYSLLTAGNGQKNSRGHIEGDQLFWGDLCRERIRYIRNFVFEDLNSLAVCPEMPYHDPAKPYANFWFISADGGNLHTFLKNFTLENIDRLVDEGGLCIAYVHFAAGFTRDGKLNKEFRKRLTYIASQNGWFVPVSEVLEHLRAGGDRAERVIPPANLKKLEARWLVMKAFSQIKKKYWKQQPSAWDAIE